MQIVTRVIKLGNQNAVVLPKQFIERYHIEKGEYVCLNISLTNKVNPNIDNAVPYKCLVCDFYFDMDEEIPYCPICGGEDTIITENE